MEKNLVQIKDGKVIGVAVLLEEKTDTMVIQLNFSPANNGEKAFGEVSKLEYCLL